MRPGVSGMFSRPMLKRLCTAKIAGGRVTKAALRYDGSLGVDAAVLKAAGIRPYEMVLISNVDNGRRFETYTIPEPAGSGNLCLYGGAAHMGKKGEELIIMAYGYFTPSEAARFKKPCVVRVAAGNRLQQARHEAGPRPSPGRPLPLRRARAGR